MYEVLILSNISNSSSTQQNKSAPANGRRAVPRKEEAQMGVRSSAGAVKVAVVLKPSREKSSNVKTNLKTAASTHLQNKCLTISQTLSTSSLGSELVKEGPLVSPRKDVQEVPDKHKTTEGVDLIQQSEDVREGFVADQREATGKALITEAGVEKPRNPSRVSTMSKFKYLETEDQTCMFSQLTFKWFCHFLFLFFFHSIRGLSFWVNVWGFY